MRRLPFGIELKSFVIGGLFVWFVLPFIMGWVSKLTSKGE